MRDENHKVLDARGLSCEWLYRRPRQPQREGRNLLRPDGDAVQGASKINAFLNTLEKL